MQVGMGSSNARTGPSFTRTGRLGRFGRTRRRWRDVNMAMHGQSVRHRVEAQLRSSPDNPALRQMLPDVGASAAPTGVSVFRRPDGEALDLRRRAGLAAAFVILAGSGLRRAASSRLRETVGDIAVIGVPSTLETTGMLARRTS